MISNIEKIDMLNKMVSHLETKAKKKQKEVPTEEESVELETTLICKFCS